MRHRNKGKILDRKIGPRTALLKSLANSLVLFEHIKTTSSKAKAVRPFVERLVTLAKVGTLTSRRELAKTFTSANTVKKLLEVLGPRYLNRAGGYTRIVRLGHRLGDAAEMSQIEFV